MFRLLLAWKAATLEGLASTLLDMNVDPTRVDIASRQEGAAMAADCRSTDERAIDAMFNSERWRPLGLAVAKAKGHRQRMSTKVYGAVSPGTPSDD